MEMRRSQQIKELLGQGLRLGIQNQKMSSTTVSTQTKDYKYLLNYNPI